MNKQLNLQNIIIKHHKLISDITTEGFDKNKNAYYNAFLLTNFGIVVDKPMLLTKKHIKLISKFMHLNIPKSFYNNPQDTKYFTCEELLIEQLISYYYVENGLEVGRIEIFKNSLPKYVIGDELVLRTFDIISLNDAEKLAKEIIQTYCSYTRPFSIQECEEFEYLYSQGYYQNEKILCKENIISLLEFDINLAGFLDKKDIVKISTNYFGESSFIKKEMKNNPQKLSILKQALDFVQDCPMTKKQAKFYNKVCDVCQKNTLEKASNEQSPDKLAKAAIRDGDILKAAKIYASNGSMLERRIKMLLSRASQEEMLKILELLPSKNPIVLYQMINGLASDDGKARVFTFFKNNKMTYHEETDYEQKWRKSVLNDSTIKFLKDQLTSKIKSYYTSLPSLGKIYIDKNFYKIGVPTNTSSSGVGLDVYPVGSRIPLTEDNIRTFVHWNNIDDIDLALLVVDKYNNVKKIDFTNYNHKPFNENILFSGDVRTSHGAEFFDIKLRELEQKGYKYIIQELHGYGDKFDKGETYVGYQNKKDLKTKAWDPKNIAMQYRIVGDSCMAMSFAIDIKKRELVMLNVILNSYSLVADESNFSIVEKFLNPSYLDINIGLIAECRGEITFNPNEADVIFSDTYIPLENQILYKSFNIPKLVDFVNEKNGAIQKQFL